MYLHNKYCSWYYNIIQKAQSRISIPGIVEKHHILPKSLGGTNDVSNLVSLTPREHYICHLLLTRMVEGKAKQKMVYALWAIMNLCNRYQERKVIKGRLYESLRHEYIQSQKDKAGPLHPNRGRKTGRTKDSFTAEWKANISAAKKESRGMAKESQDQNMLKRLCLKQTKVEFLGIKESKILRIYPRNKNRTKSVGQCSWLA